MHSEHSNRAARSITRRLKSRPWFWASVSTVILGIAAVGWHFVRVQSHATELEEAFRAARDRRSDASERLNKLLARNPDDAEVVEAFVVYSLREGVPFERIEPQLNHLCKLRADSPDPFRTRASLRIRNGRPAEGIVDGLHALELDPNDHVTRKWIAEAAIEAWEHEIAVRELGRLMESSPFPRRELAAMLVRVYLQARDVPRAEATLIRYFPAPQTEDDGQLLHGLVHHAAGRHLEAVAALQPLADRSYEQWERVLYALAQSQSALRRDDDARRTLAELDAAKSRERAILDARQQPDNMFAQIRSAEAYLANGKPKQAAELLERAMLKLGRHPAAEAVVARAYRKLGREDLAKQWDPHR